MPLICILAPYFNICGYLAPILSFVHIKVSTEFPISMIFLYKQPKRPFTKLKSLNSNLTSSISVGNFLNVLRLQPLTSRVHSPCPVGEDHSGRKECLLPGSAKDTEINSMWRITNQKGRLDRLLRSPNVSQHREAVKDLQKQIKNPSMWCQGREKARIGM